MHIAVSPLWMSAAPGVHIRSVTRGLMANDSLLVAAAGLFGIPNVATNDADLSVVPWLAIYRATDRAVTDAVATPLTTGPGRFPTGLGRMRLAGE